MDVTACIDEMLEYVFSTLEKIAVRTSQAKLIKMANQVHF